MPISRLPAVANVRSSLCLVLRASPRVAVADGGSVEGNGVTDLAEAEAEAVGEREDDAGRIKVEHSKTGTADKIPKKKLGGP